MPLKLIAAFLGIATMASAQLVPPIPQATGTPSFSRTASMGPYHPISGVGRMKWFLSSTVGPQTLAVGLFSAGLGTARNAPKVYGGSFDGFAKRYGMRLSGVSTGNVMEAGFGALWGEDPRYFPTYQLPLRGRVRNVVTMTFLAHNRQGRLVPAYSRYMATPGNNFLSNTWRADSEANTRAALVRTLWGFAGLMGKDAVTEFWPDIRRAIFRRKEKNSGRNDFLQTERTKSDSDRVTFPRAFLNFLPSARHPW